MSSAVDMYVLLRALAQELARCGMRAACTAPGSRCAPLVLTLAHEPGLRCFSHIDERCAGFFALGIAKASGLPVAVACTSGTAAAELLPAAVEAQQARVPLLIMTADRPPELRDSGAGQTIDQLKLFGGVPKWFVEVDTHDASPASLRWIRTLACRAFWTALEGRPGVVHLNFPLREPLVVEGELPRDESARGDGVPFVLRPPGRLVAREEMATLHALAEAHPRAVLVAGREERMDRDGPARGPLAAGPADQTDGGARASAAHAAASCAAACGWPLLADPLSGARRGPAAIAHYDLLLREPAFAAEMRPQLVIRIGDLPTSKPLGAWLAALKDVPHVTLDPEGAWQDPAQALGHSLALDPATALSALAQRAAPKQLGADPQWLEAWRGADQLAARAIAGVLEPDPLSEPAVAAELAVLLPEQAMLFVASSMPVRDVEAFWPALAAPPRVLCNRGANGIDGTVSSAFGVAAHAAGPVVLLIGDVALAHDLGGLLAARRLGLSLTIVLLNNGGGAIFDFLPLAKAAMARAGEIYEQHIATPTGLDFAAAAALYGLDHERIEDAQALREALPRALASKRASILEVPGERSANLALHERAWEAAARELNPQAAGAAPPA